MVGVTGAESGVGGVTGVQRDVVELWSGEQAGLVYQVSRRNVGITGWQV